MPTRDEILRTDTFKDQTDTLEQRIYYTLTNSKGMELNCAIKASTLALKILREKDVITDDELDDVLLECLQ